MRELHLLPVAVTYMMRAGQSALPQEEPRVSGTIVRGQLDVLEARFGSGLVRTAISELPVGARAALESVTASAYVPISAYQAFYEVMARLAGRSLPEFHAEM